MARGFFDWRNIAAFTLIFLAGEVLAAFWLYPRLSTYMNREGDPEQPPLTLDSPAVLVGILERFCLFAALTLGVQQALTVFAALKVGSRFDQDKRDKVKTDYFLAGNFTSLALALLYFLLYSRSAALWR